MRIVAHCHKYVPVHNAGAEAMLHEILLDLIARGHEAYVTHPNDLAPYRLDDVVVFNPGRKLNEVVAAADVVITHLDRTRYAILAARAAGKPVAHLVHNDRQLVFHHVEPGPDVLIVANSEWLRDAIRWPGAIIVRPPVTLDRYRIPGEHHRDAITLVNLTNPKGAGVFYDLAKAMPARPFLGVTGAYGTQDVRRRRPRNVDIVDHSSDIVGDVYARTRLVLMPSSYESWGRVGIEAAVNGIPTIAAPTPGLLESLGDAGIFAKRTDLRAWRRAIEDIDDPTIYASASAHATARAAELERVTAADLDGFEAALIALVEERRRANPGAYDADIGILASTRAGIRCPICKASACACKVGGKDVMASVTVIDRTVRRSHRTPIKTYRTFRGDFRLSEEGARARGLLPDGEALPAAVTRRLSKDAGVTVEDIEDIDARYGTSSDKAREAFLTELAMVGPNTIRAERGRLTNLLAGTGRPATAAAEVAATGSTPPLERRVGDVLAWAGDDIDRLEAAIAGEKAGKKRPKLLSELERRRDEA